MSNSFISTTNKDGILQWKTFGQFVLSDKEKEYANKLGREDASGEKGKYDDSIRKYNNELTDQETIIFEKSKLKKELNSIIENNSRVIADAKGRIDSIVKNLDTEINNLENNYENEIEQERLTFENQNQEELGKFNEIDKDLKKFRVENKLENRKASYPDSRLLNWGIIVFLVFIETLLNSYFYAQTSNIGVIGGIGMASGISLINVLISGIIGFYILRNLNLISKTKKRFSILGLIFAILLLIFLYLVAARYVDLASQDLATIDVVKKTWNNPFDLKSFDSYLLILVGIIVSFFTIIDTYKIDDPYPDYGKRWRKYEEERAKYFKKIENFRKKIYSIYDDYKNKLNHLIEKKGKEKLELNQINADLKAYKESFANSIESIKDSAYELSNQYRSSYNNIIVGEGVRNLEHLKLNFNENIKNKILEYLHINNSLENLNKLIDYAQEETKNFENKVDNLNSNKQQIINKFKNQLNMYSADSYVYKDGEIYGVKK